MRKILILALALCLAALPTLAEVDTVTSASVNDFYSDGILEGDDLMNAINAYRAPLKTLIAAGRLNFRRADSPLGSHLRLAKTLTARQAACVFCKPNPSKIHLVGRRVSF